MLLLVDIRRKENLMKKRNLLASLLIVLGILVMGTLAVSADSKGVAQTYSSKNPAQVSATQELSQNKAATSAIQGKSSNLAYATGTQANANCYKIPVYGNVLVSESKKGMNLINQYRKAKGKNAIAMDSLYENYSLNRAAEISLYYDKMRPNGTPGADLLFGYYSEDDGADITYWFNNKLDSEMKELLLGDDWKSGWVGVFRSQDGYTYVAVDFSSDAAKKGDTSGYNEKLTYYFNIDVQDKCLNTKAYLFDRKINIYNRTSLTKGQTYYYMVANKNSVGDISLFPSQTTTTSNSKVISVKKDGTLYAKYPGVAKITVKPATQSKLAMSKTLAVLPSKVGGVKLTAKKRAVKVTWKKTTGAAGYKIYRATSKKGKYSCVKTVSSKTTSFTNKKLKKKKTYYYKVCAFVKSGKTTWNGAYSSVAGKKTK